MIPFYQSHHFDLDSHIGTMLNFPPHLHSAIELLYVQQGEIEVTVNNITRRMTQGDFVIIFPNSIHSYNTSTPNQTLSFILTILNQKLTGDYLNELIKYHPQDPFILNENLHKDIPYAMETLLRQHQIEPNLSIYKAYVHILLARVFPHLTLLKNTDANFFDLTYKMISYISQNFQQPLSLDILAARLGVSKCHLSRIFSTKIHINFNDYINSIRIDYAQNLLRSTDKSITQICFESGFESQRTFNRAFKKIFGMNPREYLAQLS